MNVPFEISSFGVAAAVLVGLALLALLQLVRRGLRLLPQSHERRARLDRIFPVFETLLALVYLLSAVPLVLDDPRWAPIGVAVVLLGLGWVSWFAIRDFVSGAFLKAGGLLVRNDRVRLGPTEGRIVRLGYRTLTLECDDGTLAVVPYSSVTSESIVRTPSYAGSSRHAFRIEAPPGLPVADAFRAIRETVLTHHWASATRAPEIRFENDGFEVVAFALAPERGPEIREAVEAALFTRGPDEPT